MDKAKEMNRVTAMLMLLVVASILFYSAVIYGIIKGIKYI